MDKIRGEELSVLRKNLYMIASLYASMIITPALTTVVCFGVLGGFGVELKVGPVDRLGEVGDIGGFVGLY